MSGDLPRPSPWVLIPPPVWALFFVLSAWWAGALLNLPPLARIPLAGWPIFVLGFAISASGRFAFSKAGTEVMPASQKNSVLVTSGPFQYTRNPMYLGILVAITGIAFIMGTLASFAAAVVFFLFVNFISIPYEEEKMERQFGDDYRAYKARVRRWI